jgi:glucose-6-phosphate isomerase
MGLKLEPLHRWPQATLHPHEGKAWFLSSGSGFERCLERDLHDQNQAMELGATFQDCKRLIVVGIGGSAMGLRALNDALGKPEDTDRLVLLDHLNPDIFYQAVRGVDEAELGLIIISRSGTTIEVLAWLREVLGHCNPGRVAVVTATPDSPLGRLAQQKSWPTLSIPDDVGGRFSILTPCALLPASALGFDVPQLLQGARDANPLHAHQTAADLNHLMQGGHHRLVHFFYGEALSGLAGWWLQLLAESIVKSGLPFFAAAAMGPRDQHAILQLLMEGADRQALVFSRWMNAPYATGQGPDLLPLGSIGLGELERTRPTCSAQRNSSRCLWFGCLSSNLDAHHRAAGQPFGH